MKITADNLKKELRSAAKADRAEAVSRFFKTGKGEYGEGDIFLGLYVPTTRKISKKYTGLSFSDLSDLLDSDIHEFRLSALYILSDVFKKTDKNGKEKIFNFYIKKVKRINNWDLVDTSAPGIVGEWLKDKDRKILYTFAKDKNLWKKRVAIISTFAFIKGSDLKDTFAISEILLTDQNDLIHKAVGWMLREAGKRDEVALKKFLDKFATKMPRTMLRYAIEKFNKKDYQYYLCLKP